MTQSIAEVRLEHLTADANVRLDLRLDPQFVKSVRANGIIQPPVVYPDPDTIGRYRIIAGHRRVAAAAQLGHDSITVIVRDAPLDDAERVVDQLVENIHRDALTLGERAAATQQLALDFGLPAIEISKRTALKLDHIGDNLKIAASPAATAILEQVPTLTLDVLAQIAEFDDDPDAVKKLTQFATTEPDRLPHVIHGLRTARRLADETTELTATLTTLGIPVIKVDVRGFAPQGYQSIGHLVRPTDPDTYVSDLPVEEIAKIPGISVGVYHRYDNGYSAAPLWAVADGTDHGLLHRWQALRDAETDAETDEERTTREAQEAADRAASEAREAAALAARTVRRAWLTELLARPKLPNGADQFAAIQIIDGLVYLPEDEDLDLAGDLLVFDLLGITAPDPADFDHEDEPNFEPYPRKEALRRITDLEHRPAHVLLALALTASESRLERGVRRGDPEAVYYLNTLKDWGYGLSDHEIYVMTPHQNRANSAGEA